MARAAVINDFVTPLKQILSTKSRFRESQVSEFIDGSHKLHRCHLGKKWTVDQSVAELLRPEWMQRVKRFNVDEWQSVADEIWKTACRALGKVPKPEIYLYPSFGRHNGRVYLIDKRPIIACSPDFPMTCGKNIRLILAHEYAHFARWRTTGLSSENTPLFATLYEEGWATWQSSKLLPGGTLSEIFMARMHKLVGLPDPQGGYMRWCRTNLKAIAAAIAPLLQSRERNDERRFFEGARFDGDNTPIRAGYYLGYRMVEMLADLDSPRELLLLRPTRRQVSQWVNQLIINA